MLSACLLRQPPRLTALRESLSATPALTLQFWGDSIGRYKTRGSYAKVNKG